MIKASMVVFFELILLVLVWAATYIFSIASCLIKGGGLHESLFYILYSPAISGVAPIFYGQTSGRWAYINGISGESYKIISLDLILFFVSSYLFANIIYIENFKMELFGSRELGFSLSLSLIYFIIANLKYFFVKFGLWP